MKSDLEIVKDLGRQATEAFCSNLDEVESKMSFGFDLNPGRRFTRPESEKLVAIIDRVEERREARRY